MTDKIIGGVLAAFAVAFAFLLFVALPIGEIAAAECLRLGYPKAQVTMFGLGDRYCIGHDVVRKL